MMGSSRTDEKGKAPAYANIINLDIDEDNFDPPRVYSMNPNSLQNPQTNLGLSDWNMGWGQQYMNQGHNAPNNVGSNTDQSGVQGKFEGNFLSLGLGGASETVSNEGFMGFQRNNRDRMASTNYEVGVHSTLNSGRHHVSQMQGYDGGKIRSGDLDRYKSNQSVQLQRHNLKPPECVKPLWMQSCYTPSEQLQHFHSTTANSPNYAGQVASQNDTPHQALGGNLFSQRTATPQVSWVGRGSAGTDAPFPKRLGIEFSVRNFPQSSQGHLSSLGTSLQTASSAYADQIRRFSDKGSTPHNVVRPMGQSDGVPVGYRVNYQEPYFTYGQSQNAQSQLTKGPQGAPSTIASTVDSQSQNLNFHVMPHHKRTAVAPQSSSHWVKRQKIIHPTIHHSMPKPHIPVTTALVHPSIPVRSRAQPTGQVTGHVAPHIRHVVPRVSSVKPRVHVASAPAVSHITWKDPDTTSKLSGRKCFLCKRDLALTSEGAALQPSVPPPVAILPCGHTFHDQCLQNITPNDQANDPPCIPCAIGEN